MTRIRALIVAVAALALALGAPLAASAVTADTSDFSFESFDGRYVIETDAAGRATMHVTETIVALFPEFDQNRGIVRAIPLKDGDVPLQLQMISIRDETGAPVAFERDDYDGFAEFALGTDEFVHGRTTYVLEYTMNDTIRYFADSAGDEFYWDINGTGWAQQFGTVSAHVTFSPDLAAHLTGAASCYVGYYGDSTQCDLQKSDDGSVDATVGPVPGYNTLTLAIGLDGGTVVQPPLPRDSWIVQVAPKVLFWFAVVLLVASIIVKNLVWRDARGRGTIIAQFEPPDDSTLLLDANILGRTSSGLQALFVDFAVRGLLRVIDTDPEGNDDRKNRFALQLVTDDGATERERRVLVLLFGSSLKPGKRILPGRLDASIGASLSALPATTAAEALKDGVRAVPNSRIPTWFTRAVWLAVLGFVPIVVWAIAMDVLEGNVIWPFIGTFILAVAIPSVLIKPPRLTRHGAEAKEYLRGLREYLTIAEEQRLRVLQSPEGADRIATTDQAAIVKLNERLLPYAVLWGVEDQWVEQLRAAYPQGTPEWFEGADFSSSMFSDFTRSSVSAVRPIPPPPSSGGGSWSSSGGSSSFSGSSGGGFSGGGGGGGGGGGR